MLMADDRAKKADEETQSGVAGGGKMASCARQDETLQMTLIPFAALVTDHAWAHRLMTTTCSN
jgi:hypothetical protein